ncbi:glycine cleavage system protein GcvH [Stigmatella aurantiaca]|uniref:Glycine cleavage system H protein n=1 Tax=Stigmatella aurantiaca (strain DW4/3-1) TaxID=378806 RepID=Q096X8_STIAD|nr:glycine cleavage system protein GcvH [Stigmatella aurantiaca]ADO71403.1 Glycine cleavage system H protein [Stigmatella aurantiaca DW4/3-1]EAU67800.1 glycine cleavage system H protein [Stigmatella aurantiaca DW4/3-1]
MSTEFPTDVKYTKDHEWVRVQGNVIVIGLTNHAQKQLGDVVYVELPKEGDTFEANEPFGSVESVKAVSEVYAPVSGKVVRVNGALNDSPETVNDDPYGDGWFIELQPSGSGQLDELLDSSAYASYVKEEASE